MSGSTSDAIASVIADADNPVAAARALARWATRHRPEYEGERAAARWEAEQALRPYHGGDDAAAKAVAWAVLDAGWTVARGNGDRPGPAPPTWPAEPDLPGPPEPGPLPVDALPPALRAHVESVAAATQTPPDLGVLLGLAAVSASVAGKVRVVADRRRGWSEPVGIYAAAILPPGARKSPTYERYERPIREWEREAQREAAPGRRGALDRVGVLEGRLRKAVSAAAGSGDPDALLEVEDARRELDRAEAEVPRLPRLLTADATPEALVRLLAEHDRIALLAPEGDPFRIADGRYSRGGEARLDELKRAWSAEAIRVDRVGREPVHVPRPALVLAVTMQPSVLETLANARSFRGEGVLARVLWAVPDPRLGSRLTGRDVPPLDREAERRYGALVCRLLDAPAAGEDDDGHLVPHELALSEDSEDTLHGYEAEIEREIGDGGRLAGIPDWAAKACGQAVRLAGLLELAARAEDGRPLWSEPIGRWAMEGGVRLMRALTAHALHVLAEVEADRELTLLRRVLDRARELPPDRTLRDLHQSLRGTRGLEGADALRTLVEELERRGCLRLVTPPQEGPGRPPSPTVELHPSLRPQPESASSISSQPRSPGPGAAISRILRTSVRPGYLPDGMPVLAHLAAEERPERVS